MKVPYAAKTVISREKLRDYVLSLAHPIGRAKAAWAHAVRVHSNRLADAAR